MKIQCPICNNEYKQLTIAHIRNHSIQSFEEFRKLYPNIEYVSSETRKAAGDISKKDLTKYYLYIKSNKQKLALKIQEYNNNPDLCKECNIPLPFRSRKIFCSHKCSTTFNMRLKYPTRIQKIIRVKYPKFQNCKSCFKQISSSNTTKMCRACWIQTDKFLENCGKTFSKTRKYITHPETGEIFYIMSSYEEEYFQYCVQNKIKITRAKRIQWLDLSGKSHFYTPDFYLPEEDKNIEIKGYLTKEDKIKMECVFKQHPEIKIDILYKKDIEKLKSP